jgi:protein involved in polysaccharide export with SLBB domain
MVEIDETSRIIRDEVVRLPEKYRAVTVLCYWEGLSQEQAAAHLGCPIGTVRSRMARGKELLRKRLARRGVGATGAVAGLDATVGGTGLASAIPNGLVSSVVKAGVELGAGKAVIDVTTSSVAALAQSVLGSIVMVKVKTAVVCFGLLGLGALGVGLAAPEGKPDKPRAAAKRASQPDKNKAQPPLVVTGDYVVEPPDLLVVEVLEALPGRPIGGERLIRPDGKISLGFYGELYVSGLTLPEVKAKIVNHLRKFIADETLGLVVGHPETGEAIIDPETKKPKLIDPKDTDRVFVDVTTFNSKNYYIQGEVLVPGRLPVTGAETILDAINFASGLTPQADHDGVMLYRKKKDGTLQSLPINIDQILMGDDLSTNYQLKAGDRLVVPRASKTDSEPTETNVARPSQVSPSDLVAKRFPGLTTQRQLSTEALGQPSNDARNQVAERRGDDGTSRATLDTVDQRLSAVEHKLDAILKLLEKQASAQ